MHQEDETLAAATGNRYYGVGGFRAIAAYFGNYVNFTGRSTRREYWWFQLMNIIIVWAIMLLMFVPLFGSLGQLLSGSTGNLHGGQIGLLIAGILILLVYGLATIIPSLSLVIRRFRDAGVHWGIYVLLQIVTFIGSGISTAHQDSIIGSLLIIAGSLAIFVITVLPSKNRPQATED